MRPFVSIVLLLPDRPQFADCCEQICRGCFGDIRFIWLRFHGLPVEGGENILSDLFLIFFASNAGFQDGVVEVGQISG